MLGKVYVDLDSDSPVLTDASPVCSNLTKFFNYITSLKELVIGGCLLQYLIMGGVLESPLTAMADVKTLHILSMSFRNVEEFSGAFYLITSCPKLQELTIECDSNNNVGLIVHFLRAPSISYGDLKLLQKVNMSSFSGYEMEMEFVRFKLASAPVLEKISVWNFDCLLVLSGKRIMDEMKEFRRASPDVEFIVEEVEAGAPRSIEPPDDHDFDY